MITQEIWKKSLIFLSISADILPNKHFKVVIITTLFCVEVFAEGKQVTFNHFVHQSGDLKWSHNCHGDYLGKYCDYQFHYVPIFFCLSHLCSMVLTAWGIFFTLKSAADFKLWSIRIFATEDPLNTSVCVLKSPKGSCVVTCGFTACLVVCRCISSHLHLRPYTSSSTVMVAVCTVKFNMTDWQHGRPEDISAYGKNT